MMQCRIMIIMIVCGSGPGLACGRGPGPGRAGQGRLGLRAKSLRWLGLNASDYMQRLGPARNFK